MTTQKATIETLKSIAKSNHEGFTIKATTLKSYSAKKGYAVSITNIKGKNLNLLSKKVLFCLNVGFSHIKKNLYIGGWRDTDNIYYIDLSFIETNKRKALNLKNQFKQLAIFSFKDFKTY